MTEKYCVFKIISIINDGWLISRARVVYVYQPIPQRYQIELFSMCLFTHFYDNSKKILFVIVYFENCSVIKYEIISFLKYFYLIKDIFAAILLNIAKNVIGKY